MTAKFEREWMEERINEICSGSLLSFQGWIEDSIGMMTRFTCRCEKHGDWIVTARQFIRQNSRCRVCAYEMRSKLFRKDRGLVEDDVSEKLKLNGHEFVGWVNGYKNKDSKMIARCKVHGTWTPTEQNIIRGGTSCPSCSGRGFNQSLRSFIYFLTSEDGRFIKVGISNNPKVRLSALKCNTPFGFHVSELIEVPGRVALSIESSFHKRYKSAMLSGFDGYSEWLNFDYRILSDARELSNKLLHNQEIKP